MEEGFLKITLSVLRIQAIVPISALRRNLWNEKYIQTSLNIV
jgi:hypothetical protein